MRAISLFGLLLASVMGQTLGENVIFSVSGYYNDSTCDSTPLLVSYEPSLTCELGQMTCGVFQGELYLNASCSKTPREQLRKIFVDQDFAVLQTHGDNCGDVENGIAIALQTDTICNNIPGDRSFIFDVKNDSSVFYSVYAAANCDPKKKLLSQKIESKDVNSDKCFMGKWKLFVFREEEDKGTSSGSTPTPAPTPSSMSVRFFVSLQTEIAVLLFYIVSSYLHE
jgi:hypothetical protein